jgi:hypothetical protein|tara:strand:- start:2196 stop:2726 length:531 start_codon:yes stop_codon:yes gene_type:complete
MLEVKNIMLSNTLNIFKYVMENPQEAIRLINNNSNNPLSKQLYDFFINIMNPKKKIGKGSKKRKRKRKRKKSLKKGGGEPTMSENSSNIIIIIGCILYMYIAFGWIPTSVISGLGIGFIALSNVGNQPKILHSNNNTYQFNPIQKNNINQNELDGKEYMLKKFAQNVLSRPNMRRI